MARIEKSIEIKVPPEKVWEMLAFDRMPEWTDVAEMKSAKYISEIRTPEDKYRVGASAHIIEKRWEYDAEITESVENEKLTYHTKGKYSMTNTLILKPVEDRTKLTIIYEFEMPWGILGNTLYKLWQGTEDKMFEKASEKLKSILEK